MTIEICAECGRSLGSFVQGTMLDRPKLCLECETIKQTRHMLALLPSRPDDPEWDLASEWEQEHFLDGENPNSFRSKFEKTVRVSEKEFWVLERIYDKLR